MGKRGIVNLAKPGENYHELPASERQRRIRVYYDRLHGRRKDKAPSHGEQLGASKVDRE